MGTWQQVQIGGCLFDGGDCNVGRLEGKTDLEGVVTECIHQAGEPTRILVDGADRCFRKQGLLPEAGTGQTVVQIFPVNNTFGYFSDVQRSYVSRDGYE